MSTQVATVGFELSFSENIGIGEFYQNLESNELGAISIDGKSHHLLTNVCDDGFIVGLVLTYKGDKKILATIEEKNLLKIEKIELKDNQNSTAVSMFCINPESKRGFYYSYYNGVTNTTFCKLFKKVHDEIRESKIKDKIEEISDFQKKKVKDVRVKAAGFFKGGFAFTLLQNHVDIKNLLQSFMQINRFTMACKLGLDNEPLFKPVSGHLKKATFSISVSGEKNGTAIGNAINQMRNRIVQQNGAIESLKIFGRSLTGAALEETLGDSLQHYGIQTFDRYVELLPTESWDKYLESSALKNLVGTAKYQNVVIGKPSADKSWMLASRKNLKSEG